VKTQEHEILLIGEVADRLRLSVTTVNRLLTERRNGVGNFPLTISAVGCKKRWLAKDIDKYIESQGMSEEDKNSDFERRQIAARETLRKHGIVLKGR